MTAAEDAREVAWAEQLASRRPLPRLGTAAQMDAWTSEANDADPAIVRARRAALLAEFTNDPPATLRSVS